MLWGKGIDTGGAVGEANARIKVSEKNKINWEIRSVSFPPGAIRLPLLTAYMNGRKEYFLRT